MRRSFIVPILIWTVFVSMTAGTVVGQTTWNVRTYNHPSPDILNEERLHYLLYALSGTTVLANNDVISFVENLDNRYAARTNNGVTVPNGIMITGLRAFVGGVGNVAVASDLSLDFINPILGAVGQNVHISSSPNNFNPLFDISYQIVGGAAYVGHLNFVEPYQNANTRFILEYGKRNAVFGGDNNDELLVDGGGAMRVVGYSGDYPNIPDPRGVGMNAGVQLRFSQNQAVYGGALFAKEQNRTARLTAELVGSIGGGGESSGIASIQETVYQWIPYLNEMITFDRKAEFVNNRSTLSRPLFEMESNPGGDGGAVYAAENSSILFLDTKTYDTYRIASQSLGNVYSRYSMANSGTRGALFEGNIAENSGGGVAVASNGSFVNMDSTVFNNNKALGTFTNELGERSERHGAGGGLYTRDTGVAALLGGTTFTGNSATQVGGGISVSDGSVVLLGGEVVMTENTAAGYGGAIFIKGEDGLTATVTMMDVYGKIEKNTHARFQRNVNGALEYVPNAFVMDGDATLNISASVGRTSNGRDYFDIYDPIESSGTDGNTINFGFASQAEVMLTDPITGRNTVSGGGLGTTLNTGIVRIWDDSSFYFGDTNVYSGTLELADGARRDVGPTQYSNILAGDFTVGSGMLEAGELVDRTDITQNATVRFDKFTGPDAEDGDKQYTTLRANSITMNGGVFMFVGREKDGSISPTGEFSESGLEDDTAKIEVGGAIILQGATVDPEEGGAPITQGTGHGGTFYMGEQQEYNLHLGLTGAGNFTKAGSGLLKFHIPDDDPDDGVPVPTNKRHTGLTIVSGGNLRFMQNNMLALARPIGDDGADNGELVDKRGRVIHDIGARDGDGNLAQLVTSRGVVLTLATASETGSILDLADTAGEYRTQTSDGDADGDRYREQTVGALAGEAGTIVRLNSVEYSGYPQVILTVSEGWDSLETLNTNFGANEFEGGAHYDHYFSGRILGGGKLIKRGKGYLGLAGANELTEATELQGGGLYLGHVAALGLYDEEQNIEKGTELGLIKVFGADEKTFGIRNDKDYNLQVRLVADPNSAARVQDSGTLTIDANSRLLTFENLKSADNGGVINMLSGATDPNTGHTLAGTSLDFTGPPTEEGNHGYVFKNNASAGKGGAIYAGGNLRLVGNTLFSNNTSAAGAVYVAGWNDGENQCEFVLDTTNGDIAFEANNQTSVVFGENIDMYLSGGHNVYFDAPIQTEFGGNPNNLSMTIGLSQSFVQFTGNNAFGGDVLVSTGTFRLAGARFEKSDRFTVDGMQDGSQDDSPDGAPVDNIGTLAGFGTIQANEMILNGLISPDSADFAIPNDLRPKNEGRVIPEIAMNKRRGSLTLIAPVISLAGTFAVDLDYNKGAKDNNNGHVADILYIQNDTNNSGQSRLDIENTASLVIDPEQMNFGKAFTDGATFTIIKSDEAVGGRTFQNVTHARALPRFLRLVSHGLTRSQQEYYLQYGASGWTFSNPAETRNQKAVAGVFNALIPDMYGLGGFNHLIYEIATLQDDGDVRKALEEISPDIRANSLALGFSEPWRPVFDRMVHRDPGYRIPQVYRGQYRVPFKTRPREIWFDSYYRGVDTQGDGNSRTYGISRTGFALGIEKEMHDDIRIGAVFGYASPYLFTSGGRVDANDFQGGLYTLFHLPAKAEFRAYIGMGLLDYKYKRYENFAGSGEKFGSVYNADFSGQTIAYSMELSRPFRWTAATLFLPIIAFDHQTSHQDAFVEENGRFNQAFRKADFSQSTIRFGLNMQFGETDAFILKTRLQYGVRLEDTAPVSISGFADLAAGPEMRIEGIVLGSNYVNLGIGSSFYLNPLGTSKMFFNYDGDITERAIVNTGSAGISFQW